MSVSISTRRFTTRLRARARILYLPLVFVGCYLVAEANNSASTGSLKAEALCQHEIEPLSVFRKERKTYGPAR